MDEHLSKGISRRSMLKRVGAGAAVAWSAPILTSLRAPAFAQGTPVCEPGCPACQFGLPCGGNCACVGVPVDCFCSDTGICQTDQAICRQDSDCDVWCGEPGGRCAPCGFIPECVETSCWCPCGGGARSVPRRQGVRSVRAGR
jgi:hypothetical protein